MPLHLPLHVRRTPLASEIRTKVAIKCLPMQCLHSFECLMKEKEDHRILRQVFYNAVFSVFFVFLQARLSIHNHVSLQFLVFSERNQTSVGVHPSVLPSTPPTIAVSAPRVLSPGHEQSVVEMTQLTLTIHQANNLPPVYELANMRVIQPRAYVRWRYEAPKSDLNPGSVPVSLDGATDVSEESTCAPLWEHETSFSVSAEDAASSRIVFEVRENVPLFCLGQVVFHGVNRLMPFFLGEGLA